MRQMAIALGLLVFVAGCAQFPQLDAVVSEEAKRADYPELIPAQGLLERRQEGRITADTGPALLARADRLRARARLLRQITEVNDATRIRLRDRLRRLGG